MAITIDDSQQTTKSVYAVDANGARVPVVSATCTIRYARSVAITVDVADPAALANAGTEEARTIIGRYIAGELTKAAALGLPVPLEITQEVSTQ